MNGGQTRNARSLPPLVMQSALQRAARCRGFFGDAQRPRWAWLCLIVRLRPAPPQHQVPPQTAPRFFFRARFPAGALKAFADLVAAHLPEARALQNGGVGDQLDDRLRRIETSQGKLVELAVA